MYVGVRKDPMLSKIGKLETEGNEWRQWPWEEFDNCNLDGDEWKFEHVICRHIGRLRNKRANRSKPCF